MDDQKTIECLKAEIQRLDSLYEAAKQDNEQLVEIIKDIYQTIKIGDHIYYKVGEKNG